MTRRRTAGDGPTVVRTVSFRLLPEGPEDAEEAASALRRWSAVFRHAFRRTAAGRPTRSADLPAWAKTIPSEFYFSAVRDAGEAVKRTREGLPERARRHVEAVHRRVKYLRRQADAPSVSPRRRARLRARARRLLRKARLYRQYVAVLESLAAAPKAERPALRQRLEALEARIPGRVVFGGRARLKRLASRSLTPAERLRLRGEWRIARTSRLVRDGRAREPAGNGGVRWDRDAGTVAVQVGVSPGRWVVFRFRSRHRDLDAFREHIRHGRPWRMTLLRRCRRPERHAETARPCPACRFYMQASFRTPAPPTVSDASRGALGVDLNAHGRYALAWALVGPDGNLRATGRVGFALSARDRRALARLDRKRLKGREYQGVGRRKRPVITQARMRKFLETATIRVVRLAAHHGVPLVFDPGLFQGKGDFVRGRGHRHTRRLIRRWPVRTVISLLHRAAERLGVEVREVRERHTSQISAVKYAPLCNLSVHQGAALAIARRGLGFTERLPRAWLALSASGPGSSRGTRRGKASEARVRRDSAKDARASAGAESPLAGAARRAERVGRSLGWSCLKGFLHLSAPFPGDTPAEAKADGSARPGVGCTPRRGPPTPEPSARAP